MRTLLILTKQPTLAVAIGAVIDPARFQLIVKESVHEASFCLARGDRRTILDTELSDARAIRLIGELKGVSASSPILVYTGAEWNWKRMLCSRVVHVCQSRFGATS
jgi:hypothetical protein